jgi:hypothetical protein
MVKQTTHNKILKGLRVRNDKMSKRINKTGHRKSVKAPPRSGPGTVPPSTAQM